MSERTYVKPESCDIVTVTYHQAIRVTIDLENGTVLGEIEREEPEFWGAGDENGLALMEVEGHRADAIARKALGLGPAPEYTS